MCEGVLVDVVVAVAVLVAVLVVVAVMDGVLVPVACMPGHDVTTRSNSRAPRWTGEQELLLAAPESEHTCTTHE